MSKRRNKGESGLTFETRKGKKYWRATVTIGYDQEGKQIRKTVSGYDKSKVINKLKALEELASKTDLSFSGSIEKLFKNWIFVIKQPQIQPLSFSKYEETYRLRVLGTEFGKTDIHEVNSQIAQDFFTKTRQKHSEEVTRRALIHLKAFFEYMIDENVIYKNPCKNIKIQKEIKKNESYKCYTEFEQMQIIESLDLSDPVEMLIYIGFATGLRLGELVALEWSDFNGNSLNINKQYSRNAITSIDLSKDRKSTVRSLKTESSYRIVPLPGTAIKKLNQYKLEQYKFKMLNIEGYEKNNLIFPNEKGRYQNLNRPTRRIKTICNKLGIEYISFHAIRHSYITRLFEKGIDIKKVQKLAGHSSVETTLEIYTHVTKDQLDDAVKTLENIL